MQRRRWIEVLLAVLVLAALLAACGGDSGGKAKPTATSTQDPAMRPEAQIVLSGSTFQPKEITVKAGTKVTWINQDSFAHTVTAGTRDNPSGLFDSKNLAGGGTFSYVFDQPGTYNYFCGIHSGMDGTVIVQ